MLRGQFLLRGRHHALWAMTVAIACCSDWAGLAFAKGRGSDGGSRSSMNLPDGGRGNGQSDGARPDSGSRDRQDSNSRDRQDSQDSSASGSSSDAGATRDNGARLDDKSSGDAGKRFDGNTGRGSGAGDAKIPGTLQELLEGLGRAKPDSQASEKRPEPPRSPSSSKGLPQLMALPPLPVEVLATNLSRRGLDQAVQLGFAVKETNRVSALGISITRLIAPTNMSVGQAESLLQQSGLADALTANKRYSLYKAATGASELPHDPVKMATPCGTDRCYGAGIIHWRPQLAACARHLKIGVVDTGYDATHPAFRGRSIIAKKPIETGRQKGPDWHGTGVLALLAGDASSQTPGLLPESKFLVADIFYADENGLPVSDTASLLEALEWLNKNGAQIVNLSLSGPPDGLLQKEIDALSAKGMMFVAAVGNDGPAAPPNYPAAYPNVIAVTAVNHDLKVYRYANRGTHVDYAAPGVDIWTALPDGRAVYHSGTSFAVPYATAVLATYYGSLAVKSKSHFVEKALVTALGQPAKNPIYGRGLLMAPAACGETGQWIASVKSTTTPNLIPASGPAEITRGR